MHPLLPTACLFIGLAATAGCATAAAGSPGFELHADEYLSVKGSYLLTDGRVAHIIGTRWHPRIDFDNGRSHPLTALSATEFVTTDGCTRVVFEPDSNGTVTRVRVAQARTCAAR